MRCHIPWIYVPLRNTLTLWHQQAKIEIPELTRSSVLMKERWRVLETLRAMRRGGPAQLQVISDFDMTLTRFAHNGSRVPTTHNILDNRLLINEECGKKIRQLLHTYYPIEIDAGRTVEEKLPLMVEWWTQVHQLLIQQKIRKELLAQAVQESRAMLRDGYKALFDGLAQQNIPLLIFSAGVGDVLEEVIRHHQVFHPNICVISNYMDFDQEGALRAFKGQLIHTFNKRQGAVTQAAQLGALQGRPNVLLLGDSLGDLSMADGVAEPRDVLTVGFLNDQVEERKESYLDAFDVVLVKDETLDVPNAVLAYVTG